MLVSGLEMGASSRCDCGHRILERKQMKLQAGRKLILRQGKRSGYRTEKGRAQNEGQVGMDRSIQIITEHYRCPEEFVHVESCRNLSGTAGFFSFGPDAICYGRCSGFSPSAIPQMSLHDAMRHVSFGLGRVQLPFDIADTISALLREKYFSSQEFKDRTDVTDGLSRTAYYAVRPMLPVAVRKHLQRYALRDWRKRSFPRWPVDTSVESTIEAAMRLNLIAQGLQEIPFIWFWPDGAQACAVVTHDVETAAGRDFCDRLMDINDSFDIKSSFQIIPERRYDVPQDFLQNFHRRGFEVNVHDFNHDGKLFDEYEEFKRRAAKINWYKEKFECRGFRSGALYRNADWFNHLGFEYDMSVPNVAHLDPQHGGCCTIFPYFVGGLLEIPVTTTQDYSLFHILNDYAMEIWESQICLILKKHGVMSFIVHPDYILGEPEQNVYRNLLTRLSGLRDSSNLWVTLPGELNDWWRQRSQMRLLRRDGRWEITGMGQERARIAYAHLEGDTLVYSL